MGVDQAVIRTQMGFQSFIPPSWPVSEHTSAAYCHPHRAMPVFLDRLRLRPQRRSKSHPTETRAETRCVDTISSATPAQPLTSVCAGQWFSAHQTLGVAVRGRLWRDGPDCKNPVSKMGLHSSAREIAPLYGQPEPLPAPATPARTYHAVTGYQTVSPLHSPGENH